MIRKNVFLVAIFFSCLGHSFVFADVFVPDGLNAGDEYHLIFWTEGKIDATIADINVYNNFVNQEAARASARTGTVDGGSPGVTDGVSWKAVVSTPTVDARDNAMVEAPVYLFDSRFVAPGFNELWDGDTFQTSPIVNQFLSNGNRITWTGTNRFGFGFDGLELGNSSQMARIGGAHYNNFQWMEGLPGAGGAFQVAPVTQLNHIFALSEKLVVPSNIPEPNVAIIAALFLMSLGRRRVG